MNRKELLETLSLLKRDEDRIHLDFSRGIIDIYKLDQLLDDIRERKENIERELVNPRSFKDVRLSKYGSNNNQETIFVGRSVCEE